MAHCRVVIAEHGRLDAFLTRRFPETTRSKWQRYIREGRVMLNQHLPGKTGVMVVPGDVVDVQLPDQGSITLQASPQEFGVIHADADILVIDKPAGLIVHPGELNEPDTLVHGLLYRFPDIATAVGDQEKRPGIVHRLDKGTSGVMVVARTEAARQHLITQFQSRTVRKNYWAWVFGVPPEQGIWEGPIGRHVRDRKRFAVVPSGKPAVTRFEVVATGPHSAKLNITLLTGRTHQIRVHALDAGYALLGDPVYRRRGKTPNVLTEWSPERGRPALHAARLAFTHPGSNEPVSFNAPLPEDLLALDKQFQATGEIGAV